MHRLSLTIKRQFSSQKHHDPLRILFCGSDQFSIPSLTTLYRIHKELPSKVSSIDVLCRTDKHVGRGRKKLSQQPIKLTAQEWNLPVHQIDSFKDGALRVEELGINLIVAVSFGLLIPAHIIENSKYGGLNVHPSFLPDLKGAAPIQHAFLLKRPFTGVSVQTLHPTKFDHGKVLGRTELPGLAITPQTSPESLTTTLADQGADLLGRVVRESSFIEPISERRLTEEELKLVTAGDELRSAYKIKKEDSKLDWKAMTMDDVLLRQKVLGKLWDDEFLGHIDGTRSKVQVVFNQLKKAEDMALTRTIAPGQAVILKRDGSKKIYIKVTDGVLELVDCTIEGRDSAQSMSVIKQLLLKSKI